MLEVLPKIKSGIQYNRIVSIWWYAISQQDVQQLHWPHNLNTIKVLSFVPWNRFHRAICWVITWCWCDFLRGQNWPKISTNKQLAAVSLPYWGPFHYACRCVSCCFSAFSENHSEIVVKASNQMLWDSGKLGEFRATQSAPHPLVCVRCKVSSARNVRKP